LACCGLRSSGEEREGSKNEGSRELHLEYENCAKDRRVSLIKSVWVVGRSELKDSLKWLD
jgi:hypothetical protein